MVSPFKDLNNSRMVLMGSGASLLNGADGNLLLGDAADVHEWWDRVLAPLNANQRRSAATIVMYTTWNI